MSTLPVLLIEPHAILRQSITHFLNSADETGLLVSHIGALGELDPAQLGALCPRVILLGATSDLRLVYQAIGHLRRCLPDAAIVVLGLLDSEEYRSAALRAGADRFIAKQNLMVGLLPIIRQVLFAYQERFA